MSRNHPILRVLTVLALLLGFTVGGAASAGAVPTDSGARLISLPLPRFSIDSFLVPDSNASVLFYSDPVAHVVWMYSGSGVLVVAGNGTSGLPSAGVSTSSPLIAPTSLAFDTTSKILYIVDTGANMVLKVTGIFGGGNPILSILAGDGVAGSPDFSAGPSFPNGLPLASASRLNAPHGIAVLGNLVFVSDTGNNSVVGINTTTGRIEPVTGANAGSCSDGNSGTVQPSVSAPRGLLFDVSNLAVLIADSGNHRVTSWSPEQVSGCVYRTIAGTGVSGSVTPGPATSSKLADPVSIDIYQGGYVIADRGNHQILGVSSSGTLSVLAGDGSADPIDFTSVVDPLGSTSVSLGAISGVRYFYGTVLLADSTNNVVAYLGNASAPTAPTALAPTPGDGSASISFTEPADNGGRVITKYQYSIDNGTHWNDADPGVTSPVSISGLTNGTSYSIKLRAVNTIGSGAASSAVSATPRSTPAAPTSVVATAADGGASISFTAGANGGAEITKYQYSTDAGLSWADATGTSSPITVTGLTNYTDYNLLVRAVNVAGAGAASAAASVTPADSGPSACPSTALSRYRITTCWNPLTPAVGKVNRYRALVVIAGTTTKVASCKASAADTQCTVMGFGKLSPATTYDVIVRARVQIAPGQVFWSLFSAPSQVTTLP